MDVSKELLDDMPAYLEFCILYHVRALRKLEPNHELVRAVQNALDQTSQPEKQEDRRTSDSQVTLCERCRTISDVDMQALLLSTFIRKALRLDEANT